MENDPRREVPDVKRGRRPVVITNAPRSPRDQLRTREIRYLLMMSVRAVCLIAAAVLVSVRPPLLGLWLVICGIGMVFVPWLAVILANIGLPKEQHRLVNRLHPRRTVTEEPGALPSATPPRVIDADE
jgi:fatty acid desaturase